MKIESDVIIVGAGLAGLVAACELADAGKKVIIVDQEGGAKYGWTSILVFRWIIPGQFSRTTFPEN